MKEVLILCPVFLILQLVKQRERECNEKVDDDVRNAIMRGKFVCKHDEASLGTNAKIYYKTKLLITHSRLKWAAASWTSL